MGKKKAKPRKRKQARQSNDKVTSFILGVVGSLVASLIESLVRKLLS